MYLQSTRVIINIYDIANALVSSNQSRLSQSLTRNKRKVTPAPAHWAINLAECRTSSLRCHTTKSTRWSTCLTLEFELAQLGEVYRKARNGMPCPIVEEGRYLLETDGAARKRTVEHQARSVAENDANRTKTRICTVSALLQRMMCLCQSLKCRFAVQNTNKQRAGVCSLRSMAM